jgi:steroid delta-isomerase-like uncharacterized protein
MPTLEERNKAVVLRLKDEVSSQGRFEVMSEIAVPGFRPRRQAVHNLAQNARDQGFPEPGHQMRKAIPDRVDRIESIVAEGEHVGMRWRVTGTHAGDLFGIPATGKPIDIQSIGVFKVLDGRIAEAWFMADEVDLLRQLGATLPKRKDGKRVYVPTIGEGEESSALLKRLSGAASPTEQHRNKVAALQYVQSPHYRLLRQGMQHMNDYGRANKVGHLKPSVAFPDRADRVECLIAEGDMVWMHFKLTGTHTGRFFGHPPTGKRIEMTEVGILKVEDALVDEAWYFGDELGLLQQVDAVHLLLS